MTPRERRDMPYIWMIVGLVVGALVLYKAWPLIHYGLTGVFQ